MTSKSFAYPLGQGEEARLFTKLELKREAAVPKQARSSDFGLKGVLVLQLGGQEIGRVPVYEPEQLPRNSRLIPRSTAQP